MAAEPVHALKLASVLLQYPSDAVLAARDELVEAVAELPPGRQREALERFIRWFAAVPPGELRREYVETFDFTRRNSLHLTYHVHGDRRQRGVALLRLKQRYAAAGLDLLDGELPDFLPVVLEYVALVPDDLGLSALTESRDALELLRSSLHDARSPYGNLIQAVVESLPGLTRPQAARVARLAAEGPPTEEVGLEPFAPPEVMPMAGSS